MALYPILDTSILERYGIPLADAIAAAVECGVGDLQVRHKGPFSPDLFQTLRNVPASQTQLLLNDRVDLAAMLHWGAHVGQDDLPPQDARPILGSHALLGFSTHNAAQFHQALSLPIDYVALGPIFPTQTKLNPDPVTGLALLEQLAPTSRLPIVAIGGITLANAPQVLRAGAQKIAVISALWQPPYTLKSFQDCVTEWQQTLAQTPR